RRAVADGRGHAGFRLRRAAEFAAVVPDQGERRPRRSHRHDAGTAGLSSYFLFGSTPRRIQRWKFLKISGVSAFGLRVASSSSTDTDRADATQTPSENTTWSNVTEVWPNLTRPSPISIVPGQRSSARKCMSSRTMIQ